MPPLTNISTVAGGIFSDVLDPFNPIDAWNIAQQCKSQYPHDTWAQIHCASVATDQYVLAHIPNSDRDPEGGGPGARSFCRDHAELFKAVFTDLQIPGSRVDVYAVNTNHVVNRIVLTGADGTPYSYMIDTGWDPDNVYPYGANAERYANDHGCNPLPALQTGFDWASIPVIPLFSPWGFFFPSPGDVLQAVEKNVEGPGYPAPVCHRSC